MWPKCFEERAYARPEELLLMPSLGRQGWEAMGKGCSSIGTTTLLSLYRNPRGGNAKALDEADAASRVSCLTLVALDLAARLYTMNLCSAKEETRICPMSAHRRS